MTATEVNEMETKLIVLKSFSVFYDSKRDGQAYCMPPSDRFYRIMNKKNSKITSGVYGLSYTEKERPIIFLLYENLNQ